jgi:hypothetical protein
MSNSLRPQFGYHFSQTQEEEKKALHKAFELVRNTRLAGAEMRLWVHKTCMQTKILLRQISENKLLTKEQKLAELRHWENTILSCLSSYMNDTSDFLNQLKFLNPPLRSEQLKPFYQAMESDRQVTINALDALTKAVAEITAYKLNAQQSHAA